MSKQKSFFSTIEEIFTDVYKAIFGDESLTAKEHKQTVVHIDNIIYIPKKMPRSTAERIRRHYLVFLRQNSPKNGDGVLTHGKTHAEFTSNINKMFNLKYSTSTYRRMTKDLREAVARGEHVKFTY